MGVSSFYHSKFFAKKQEKESGMTETVRMGNSELYELIDLGILPGFQSSLAVDLNNRGQIIGILNNVSDNKHHSFLWDKGQMTNLGPVLAKHINNKGQIVGQTAGNMRATYSSIIHSGGRTKRLVKHNRAMSMAACSNDQEQVVGHIAFINWKVPAESKFGAFLIGDGRRCYLDCSNGYLRSEANYINN
jgi:probable HAF family extracellular repeat protein